MENRFKKSEAMFNLFLKAIRQENEERLNEEMKKLREEMLELFGEKKEYLTKKEVCEIYKIHPSTFERNVRSGLAYSSNGKGCARLVKRSDVEKFKKIKNGR